jgi:hypothetical protein
MSLEPGQYVATIENHAIEESRKGFRYIALQASVEDERIIIRISLSDKAMPVARRCLIACGFDPDASDLVKLQLNPELLRGKRVPVRIEAREWEGRPQMRASIDLGRLVDRGALGEIQKKLRSANDEVPF